MHTNLQEGKKGLDRNDRLNLENCLSFFYLVLGWQVSLNCLIALNLLNDLELTCSLLVGVFWRADWPRLQDSWVLESLPLNNLIPQMISTFLLILILKITRSMKKIFPIERPISVVFITSRQDAMLWSYRWQCQLLRQNKTVPFESSKFIYNTRGKNTSVVISLLFAVAECNQAMLSCCKIGDN